MEVASLRASNRVDDRRLNGYRSVIGLLGSTAKTNPQRPVSDFDFLGVWAFFELFDQGADCRQPGGKPRRDWR